MAPSAALVLHLLLPVCAAMQSFRVEPRSQMARLGERVVFQCAVEQREGQVRWCIDDFCTWNYTHLGMHVEGDPERGEHHLVIDQVRLSHNTTYQCVVSKALSQPLKSPLVQLIVLVEPEPPVIEPATTKLQVHELQSRQLVCVSRGGSPPADVYWLLDGAIQPAVLLKSSQSSSSTLTLNVTRTHALRRYECRVNSSALVSALSTALDVDVFYAPDVHMEAPSSLREGQVAVFRCSAEAHPSQVSWRWTIDDVLHQEHSALLHMQLFRFHHGRSVKCSAENVVGVGAAETRLNVIYSPRFVGGETVVGVTAGGPGELRCRVDSNPTARITWTRPDGSRAEGESLRVARTERRHVGTYECLAKVDGFPSIARRAQLLLTGAPEMSGEPVQFGKEADTVTLQCTAHGSPQPTNLEWLLDGRRVLDSDRIRTSTSGGDGTLRGFLTVHGLQKSDFGRYNCSAGNALGSSSLIVELREHGTLLLPIILGVISGCIVVVIVIIVLVLCVKRRERRPTSSPSKSSKSTLPDSIDLDKQGTQDYHDVNDWLDKSPARNANNNATDDTFIQPPEGFLDREARVLPPASIHSRLSTNV